MDCNGWKERSVQQRGNERTEKSSSFTLPRPSEQPTIGEQNGDDANGFGIEVSLFDFMENNATDKERKAGYDIADYLLKAETKESVLNIMIAQNPHLETLISTLDLEVVSIGETPLKFNRKEGVSDFVPKG